MTNTEIEDLIIQLGDNLKKLESITTAKEYKKYCKATHTSIATLKIIIKRRDSLLISLKEKLRGEQRKCSELEIRRSINLDTE